jgi:hypothetical protein
VSEQKDATSSKRETRERGKKAFWEVAQGRPVTSDDLQAFSLMKLFQGHDGKSS